VKMIHWILLQMGAYRLQMYSKIRDLRKPMSIQYTVIYGFTAGDIIQMSCWLHFLMKPMGVTTPKTVGLKSLKGTMVCQIGRASCREGVKISGERRQRKKQTPKQTRIPDA